MPYDANGNFSPDMPAAAGAAPVDPLAAQAAMSADATGQPPNPAAFTPINRHTGVPYGTRFGAPANPLAGLPKTGTAKPGYAGIDVPMFPDYAQFAAKRDGLDLSTATDQQLLGYSKEYAEQMLPQALMASGHKIDKEYIKTLVPNFQYQTHQILPQLRDYFKSQPTTAPPEAAPSASTDYLKQLGGKALETGGDVLASGARALSDPTILLGPLGPGIKMLASQLSPTAASAFQASDTARNKNIDVAKNALVGAGQNVQGGESEAFKAKEAEPFLNEKEPWVHPDGSLNLQKFNTKAFSGPKLAGLTEDTVLPLAAALITRNPEAVAPLFGAQQSEQARKGEQDRLGKLTDAEWQQVPAYVAKIHEGQSPEDAKTSTIDESAKAQQLLGGAQGTLTGLAAGLPFFKPATGGIFSRVLQNYLKQAPSFAALAAGGQAAGTALSNVVTGEQRNPLAGTAETAVSAALGAAPFALAGGRGAAERPSETTAPTPGGEAPARGGSAGTAVENAVNNAFEEHPVPAPVAGQPFEGPIAREHYDNALSAFNGSLRAEGIDPAAQRAAFDTAWSAKTGAPVPGGEVPPEGAGETPTATPEELNTAAAAAPVEPAPEPSIAEQVGLDLGEGTTAEQAEPAPVEPGTGPEARTGSAADELPIGVRIRVEEDLGKQLGREPSPEEVAQHGQQLIDLILSDPKVRHTVPEDVLKEAVGRLVEAQPGLPEAREVNALAKKIEGERTKNPLEGEARPKAEAAPQEAGAAKEEAGEQPAHLRADELPKRFVPKEEELLASPEEKAKYQPLEDFYKKHADVLSALKDLSARLKDNSLSRVIQRMLANPYITERLSQTKLSIRNPGETAKSPTHELIGTFLRKGSKPQFDTYSATWGAFHPKDGVVLAGAGYKPFSLLNNGLHPLTFVHEALHAGLSHTIDGVLDGKIRDPEIVAAVHELENIRRVINKHLEGITTDKDTIASLKYATEEGHDIHELVSVANTDPRVQSVLSRIKMGTINAWQKLMGIFNKMLGGTPEDLPSINRIFDLSNRLIDYKPKDFVPSGERTFLSRQSERAEENTAERISAAMDIKSNKEQAQKEAERQRQNGEPTTAQKIETKIFDKLKPLTHLNEKLSGAGTPVGPKENMDDALRVYQNLASKQSVLTDQAFVTPVLNRLVQMAKNSGKEPIQFLNDLVAYYTGKHALERNEVGELQNGRLKKDAEIERQAVKEQWAAGKLSEGEYVKALKAIVNRPGARVANRSPLYASGITNDVANELIARGKKGGITPKVLEQFEPDRKAILEQTAKNYEKSGRFTEADNLRKTGLGYKWYMPFKGFGEAGADSEASGIGAFTKEYQAAGGRETISANPFLNMLQELHRSARDIPENAFTKVVYNFARKYGKELGIRIRTLDKEKAIQDAIASGKGLEDVSRVFKNENSVVHNAGDYHFSIEFPKSMQAQLDAIKSVNDTPELNGALKALSHATNFISRGATTFQIPFLFWNAFWRDMGYVGAQVGMDLGPKAAARYAANYWMKGGPLRGRSTYFKGLTQVRNALERKELAESGKSEFATSLQELAERGGDLSFENQLNQARNVGSVFDAIDRASKTGSVKEKALAVQHWLDQIGTSDIMTARVAAYEAYKNEALSKIKNPTAEQVEQIKKDGALFSRRVLDYQQRSDVSRIMNIFFPFSRVVLNQTDRILQTFKNADGSYNPRKAAMFTALGLASGAAYYALLKQAYPDLKKEENGTLSKNWVIPIGDGKVVKIPMAYGLTRLFMVPGMMLARAALGDSSNEDAANQVRNAIQEGFTPFRPIEPKHSEKASDELADLLTAMSPGVLRPVVELQRNENAFGAPITPNDAFTKGPHSAAGRPSTPEEWKWLAGMLHTVTGGAIDVYPESLRYLVGAYGTGPGNALVRATALGSKSEPSASDFPLVPSVFSRDAEFYEMREARDRQQDLEDKGRNITDAEKEELRELRSIGSRFGKERKAIYGNALLSGAERDRQLKALNTKQNEEQRNALKSPKEH